MKALPTQPMLGKLGDFDVRRELGRGGMGVVYEARQLSLNRKVALKVLNGGLGLTGQAIKRFKREAEAAAKLHHTNIVPIYATGEEDGTHFYAMELIEGPSLDQVIRQMRSSSSPINPSAAPEQDLTTQADSDRTAAEGEVPRRPQTDPGETTSSLGDGNGYFDTVARLIAEVADALDYAHKQGVIHRDIKPSNLLLSPAGRLSINDFGLARMLEEPGMTMSGEFVGSPLYMSPEQVAAGRTRLDHRTDIYSLGATLYQLLTFEPPFPGQSRDQILTQIISKEPKPPRKINRRIPLDLETICLKAMEKDADRRYQNGGEMAEDLRRFVNRFAISARRAGLAHRTAKWMRRHPAAATACCVALGMAILAGAFAYKSNLSEKRLRLEQQRKVLGDGLVAAMSGDFEGTKNAINQAELLHASAADIHLLRAQLALHTGSFSEAIENARQATQLRPNSVAAWAILSSAANYGGEWSIFLGASAKARTLKPVTAEDYFFKAYMPDTEKPVEPLNRAIALRPNFFIAYALRSSARAQEALDRGDLKLAAPAEEDARVARTLLPGTPLVDQWLLVSYLTLGTLAERLGQTNRAAQYWKEAEVEENAQKVLKNTASYLFESLYLHLRGEPGAELAFLEANAPNVSALEEPLAEAYLARAESARGLARIEKLPIERRDDRLAMMHVLLTAEAKGLQAARNLLREQYSARAKSFVWNWLLVLLGEEDAARANARELLADQTVANTLRLGARAAEYWAGQIDEKQLFQTTDASSRILGDYHFMAGVTHLHQGDRKTALEHFKKTVQLHSFLYFDRGLAEIFVARMTQDPSWPTWIQKNRE